MLKRLGMLCLLLPT